MSKVFKKLRDGLNTPEGISKNQKDLALCRLDSKNPPTPKVVKNLRPV